MNENAIVVDIGSASTKAGFPEEETPGLSFPTLVARTYDEEKVRVGEGCLELSAQEEKEYITSRSVQRGSVTSFRDYESIWDHIYHGLGAGSEESTLLISELPLTSPSSKEQILELMFETFLTPSLAFFNQSAASLYSVGRTTGLVVDSGEGKTSVLPIIDGFSCLQSLFLLDIGGEDVTNHLLSKLKRDSGNKKLPYTWAQSLKHDHLFVSKNYEVDLTEMKLDPESYFKPAEYILPDGTKTSVQIEEEVLQLPELFFNPGILSSHQFMKAKPIPIAISESVARSEAAESVRRDMFKNMVLTGGNMSMRGMVERVVEEVKYQVPDDFGVGVVEVKDKVNSVWLGGCLMSVMESEKDRYTSREEYLENGGFRGNKKLSALDFTS